MTNQAVKPKYNFDGINTRAIDPDIVDLGTRQQDCALIANTFERGAHATPTEAALFATLSRTIQNNKQFASTIQNSLGMYLNAPQEDAASAAEQAEGFAAEAGGAGGTSVQTDHIMQALNVGTQQQATYGDSFGDKLMNLARECIPCDVRLMAFLELHPDIDLLGTLENHLLTQLEALQKTAEMLTNLDAYNDLCTLLDLLSVTCIPDLQRIVALLMALFMLQVPQLDGLIGMLQGLIAPIFAPLLMQIATLLDQFTALVTKPLDCVVDAINAQLEKLNVEAPNFELDIQLEKDNPVTELSSSLKELNMQLQEGIQQMKKKMEFYVDQVKAMLDEVGGTDAAYLKTKLQLLQITRLVAFVTAIINALAKGHAACSEDKVPETSEVDNFFQNFLNPNGPFNLWIDDAGQIHIDEKVAGFDEVVDSPSAEGPLPQFGNVLQFEGDTLLDPSVAEAVEQVSAQLTEPVRVIIPCRLETSTGDMDQVNKWIEELNRA
jgi:hypothetical protein